MLESSMVELQGKRKPKRVALSLRKTTKDQKVDTQNKGGQERQVSQGTLQK